MEKSKPQNLEKKATNLTKSEVKKLERLKNIFGEFNTMNIEGNYVYGQENNQKLLLGTKKEYYEYRELKHKKSSTNKKTQYKREFTPERYNAFNLD